VLEPLGLTETEEAVYLSLLKGRGSSVDELVREVGAARNARVPPPPGSRTSAS
jgi:sugar-specific transcriptional regulator TrmB